jgi:hypothetical protein
MISSTTLKKKKTSTQIFFYLNILISTKDVFKQGRTGQSGKAEKSTWTGQYRGYKFKL